MLDRLIEFGLSEKEAKVYLALIELGPSSVTQIAKKAAVKRTNTYHLLEALMSYGLVHPDNSKNKKAVFIAERPEEFLFLMKEKMNDAQKKYEEAKDLIAELRAIYAPSKEKKVRVKYFSGNAGLEEIYDDTLTSGGDEVLSFTSYDYQKIVMPGYFPEYFERRKEAGIHCTCMTAGTKEGKFLKDKDKEHLRTTLVLPEEFKVCPEINIYADKTAIVSLKEKFGIIIESKDVADMFRKFYSLARERAEEYDKKLSDEAKSKPGKK